jgi:hypothetical protein
VSRSLEVKVYMIDNLQDYEQPLSVTYQVTGTLGTLAGKRLILPSDLLEAGSSATFSDEKRVQAVYFSYPELTQDALRINLPTGFSVEAVPAAAKFGMLNEDAYSFTVTSDATGFTARRDHAQGEIVVLPKDYDSLRKYYSQFESKDQESVVLKMTPASAGN